MLNIIVLIIVFERWFGVRGHFLLMKLTLQYLLKVTKVDLGPWANTLTNLDLPRVGTRVLWGGGGHVSGVFGSSPLKVMLTIMIYETKFKTAEKMKVKPSWAKELPEVVGQFGFNNKSVLDTEIVVWPMQRHEKYLTRNLMTMLSPFRTNRMMVRPRSNPLHSNDDLPQIINVSNSEPIEKRPFSCCATKEKIFKSWLAVGLVSFTWNTL